VKELEASNKKQELSFIQDGFLTTKRSIAKLLFNCNKVGESNIYPFSEIFISILAESSSLPTKDLIMEKNNQKGISNVHKFKCHSSK
jgi:hypothetical protein